MKKQVLVIWSVFAINSQAMFLTTKRNIAPLAKYCLKQTVKNNKSLIFNPKKHFSCKRNKNDENPFIKSAITTSLVIGAGALLGMAMSGPK